MIRHMRPPPPPPPAPGDKHGQPDRKPILRATVIRPKSKAVEDSADRLTTLAHELSSLLDGSMRSLNLVLRSREQHDAHQSVVADTDRRLGAVRTALQQMTSLISTAVGRSAWNGRGGTGPQTLSLGESVEYAVAILDPIARDAGITISTNIIPSVAGANAGPAYQIVINGLRNALDSVIEHRHHRPDAPALIEINVGEQLGANPRFAVIEIRDTGIGPPPAMPPGSPRRGPAPFDVGFSTKSGGRGLGLALCREMINELGGEISLSNRPGQPGAILRASFPLTISTPAPN